MLGKFIEAPYGEIITLKFDACNDLFGSLGGAWQNKGPIEWTFDSMMNLNEPQFPDVNRKDECVLVPLDGSQPSHVKAVAIARQVQPLKSDKWPNADTSLPGVDLTSVAEVAWNTVPWQPAKALLVPSGVCKVSDKTF